MFYVYAFLTLLRPYAPIVLLSIAFCFHAVFAYAVYCSLVLRCALHPALDLATHNKL